jgi:hypothetical protein
MDARLRALGLGRRHLLGVVGEKQRAVLAISWDYSGPLRIEIDLLVGPQCTMGAIEADPGDTLDVRIESVSSTSAAYS